MSEAVAVKPRTQEERRESTTASLMNAAMELLFERGYAALTLAQVAQRAGVSRGALNHYYPTKEQLVLASTHRAMEVEMEQIDETALLNLSRVQVVDAFFDASERFFLSRNFIAQLELVLAARNDERIAKDYFPLIAQYRSRFDNAWFDALTKSGMKNRDATELIDMTNLMFRGLSLSAAREPGETLNTPATAPLRKRLRQLFINNSQD